MMHWSNFVLKKAGECSAVWGMVLLFLVVSACQAKKRENTFDAELARERLNAALVSSVTDDDGNISRNAVIQIDAPEYDFMYTAAAGVARADTGETMTTDHQFTIASVGKTMTAVLILQLWEEGIFGENGLDVTLEELTIFPVGVLDHLHRMDGISYGREITVRQLLHQTSGLKDVLIDDEHGIGDEYPEEYRGYAPGSLNGVVVFDYEKGFEAMMRCRQESLPVGCNLQDYYLSNTWFPWNYQAWLENPSNKMAGLLNFYLGGMNETALWVPGTAFHYADTNYILLGLVIEHLTGNSLHQELRARIFEPLGMDNTYLAYSTNPPTEQWEGQQADHWGMNIPLISSGVNLSMDWGAGGEVSTVHDLNVFIRALASGDLFKREATLKEMFLLPSDIERPFYAAGIIALPTNDGVILHHNGAPGSWIEYHFSNNLSMAGTVNDLDKPDRFMLLRADIYAALKKAGMETINLKTGSNSMRLLTMLGGEPPLVVLIGLLGSVCVFISALGTWSLALLRGRQRSGHSLRLATAARWLVVGLIIVNLLFGVAFVLLISQNPVHLMFGFPASTRPLFLLPAVSFLLTIGGSIFAVIVWKNGFWNVTGRMHYTCIISAAFIFLWTLNQLNLISVLWR